MTRRVAGLHRGALIPLVAAAAFALGATGVQGQLTFGIHVARTTRSVNGAANGVGASLEVGVPLFPVTVMVAGDWFHPNCGASSGCSYMGASADLHFALPAPVVRPYLLAGAVVRRSKAGGGAGAVSDRGLALGVGVQLSGLALGAYGEVRYEFVTPHHPVVFRIGIQL